MKIVGLKISIHAPRAGSDPVQLMSWLQGQGISIHAPRAGSDQQPLKYFDCTTDFNPRSPCGERRGVGR